MALILSDTFNRADSTSSIGTPEVGGPYTVRVGTWGINSNRVYTSASNANAMVTAAATTIDADLQVTLTTLSNNTFGLVARYVNSTNYWALYHSSTQLVLARNTGGTFGNGTVLSRAFANGDVLRLIAKGAYLYAYVNGNYVASCEDFAYSAATVNHGLYNNASITNRMDDFTMNDAPTTIPGGVDGSAALYYDLLGLDSTYQTPDSMVYKGRDTATEDQVAGVA